MTTTTTTFDRIGDELVRRLMHQRIIVLGEELREDNGNRLMHQLLLLSAEDPAPTSASGSTRPAGPSPRCSPSTT